MKDRSVNQVGSISATDSMLLRAAIENDQVAWRNLVETYSGRVYRWARQAGLQDSDAADVTNQVFSSVARGLPGFHHDGESDTFRGWLRRITQHAITDWRRAQGREVCASVGGSDNLAALHNKPDDPSASAQSGRIARAPSAQAAAVEQVRASTPPDTWRIFWLLTAEEMSPQDVARECRVTLNVVYLTKHRIAKRIREQLARGDRR